ncbi:MAG TPA: ABC transporter substrate-binding protein [Burkholderiales bacterium]|nr:ABC transporter substrate-binding protein [Burkholderiales bacterium]
MTRISTFLVLAFLSGLGQPLFAQNTVAPDVLAKGVTDEVIAILRADPDAFAGNPAKVIELVENKVLPHFNFMRMTQLAVGKNWRQASAQQRDALTGQFRTLLVRTYATAFTAYRDQTISYRPLRMQPEDVDVVVRSQIIQQSGPPVGVDYSMEKTASGWKVYDVAIEGVSLVQNYRSTFNGEVQRGGIDGLIGALEAKNRQLVQKTQSAGQ